MTSEKDMSSSKKNGSKKPRKNKKVTSKIIITITAALVIIAIIIGLAFTNPSLFKKQPSLQDGKYCEVTGTFENLAGSIIYNDYFCIEVKNKQTYSVVILTEKPAALRMEKSYSSTFQFDIGEPIEITNDDGKKFTIEQLDDKTLLFKSEDGSVKREVSTDVEEDHENQADK